MSETKYRVKLVVAYDGTDFCGWAYQPGERTVKGALSEAVARIAGAVEVTGASRTDSGAHARGQVCHFDSPVDVPPGKWVRALNDLLPQDLAVVRSGRVRPDFHSRLWAVTRWYRYRIHLGPRDPLRSRYVFVKKCRSLDAAAMHDAAQALAGQHDFLAFCQELEPGENTVRTLYRLTVRQVRDEVWFDVVGAAFARGMMRRMAGALYEVGRGLRPASDIPRLLNERENPSGLVWPVVLPASGLCLMAVRYGRSPRNQAGRFLKSD